jgi:hypothetical protein
MRGHNLSIYDYISGTGLTAVCGSTSKSEYDKVAASRTPCKSRPPTFASEPGLREDKVHVAESCQSINILVVCLTNASPDHVNLN